MLRLCGPATRALPPFCDMPPRLRQAVAGHVSFLSGALPPLCCLRRQHKMSQIVWPFLAALPAGPCLLALHGALGAWGRPRPRRAHP